MRKLSLRGWAGMQRMGSGVGCGECLGANLIRGLVLLDKGRVSGCTDVDPHSIVHNVRHFSFENLTDRNFSNTARTLMPPSSCWSRLHRNLQPTRFYYKEVSGHFEDRLAARMICRFFMFLNFKRIDHISGRIQRYLCINYEWSIDFVHSSQISKERSCIFYTFLEH